jgi:SAM-dependent methyltransferase
MFWLTYLEILRVLKPNGLFYLNAPSNGLFHRYPVDCWRFYPDSGGALVTWAKRNGMNPVLLESFISNQQVEVWNDFVAIFLKDEKFFENYRDRIFDDFKNGFCSDSSSLINQSDYTEDLLKIRTARDILAGTIKVR